MKKYAAICLLATLMTYTLVYGTRPSKPPDKEDVIGRWVGYENNFPYFYSLSLRSDYGGKLVVMLPDGGANLYDVHWTVKDQTISLQVSRVTPSAIDMNCSVTSFSSRMIEMIVREPSSNWQRTVVLMKERELKARMRQSSKYDK